MDRRPGTCDRSGLLPVGSAGLSRPRSGTAGGRAGPGRPGRSRRHPRPGGPPCRPGRGPAPCVWSRRPGRAGWGWLGPSGVCRQRGGPAPAEPLRGHGNQGGGLAGAGLLQLAGLGPQGAHSPWKATMGTETLSSSSRTPGSVGWSMYRRRPAAPGSCVSAGWRVRPTLTTKALPGAVSSGVPGNASASTAPTSCPPSLPDPSRGLPGATPRPPSPPHLCPPQGILSPCMPPATGSAPRCQPQPKTLPSGWSQLARGCPRRKRRSGGLQWAGWRTAGPQGGPGGPGSTGRPRSRGPGAAPVRGVGQVAALGAARGALVLLPAASRAEAEGGAADLSVGAGPILDKHGWGVGFVVAKNRFSGRRATRGLM